MSDNGPKAEAPKSVVVEFDGKKTPTVINPCPDYLLGTMEYIRKDLAKPLPTVDQLAQIIRTVDGSNSLGAAQLAERILEALEGQ